MTLIISLIALEWLGLLAWLALRWWADRDRPAPRVPLWWAEYDAARHVECIAALKRIERKEAHDNQSRNAR
jgi:hypothetical protein